MTTSKPTAPAPTSQTGKWDGGDTLEPLPEVTLKHTIDGGVKSDCGGSQTGFTMLFPRWCVQGEADEQGTSHVVGISLSVIQGERILPFRHLFVSFVYLLC